MRDSQKFESEVGIRSDNVKMLLYFSERSL